MTPFFFSIKKNYFISFQIEKLINSDLPFFKQTKQKKRKKKKLPDVLTNFQFAMKWMLSKWFRGGVMYNRSDNDLCLSFHHFGWKFRKVNLSRVVGISHYILPNQNRKQKTRKYLSMFCGWGRALVFLFSRPECVVSWHQPQSKRCVIFCVSLHFLFCLATNFLLYHLVEDNNVNTFNMGLNFLLVFFSFFFL